MIRILVTGAGGSATGNFIDALRQSGREYYVVGADADARYLELADVERRYVVPRSDDDDYFETLTDLAIRERIDFVHPQPDPEVARLAREQSVGPARLFLPPADVIDACQDKAATNRVLAERRVPVPASCEVRDEASITAALDALAGAEGRVWLRAIRGAGARASLPVANLVQARGWLDYWRTHAGLGPQDFMISEFLGGPEFAWQSVWNNGELIAGQARERVAYLMGHVVPSGQTSTPSLARTVRRGDVDETAQAAIRAVSPRPHGVFCVDMKCDAAGVPRVTEINAGRFFTTSNFFAHAGLNMPDAYVQLGLGEPAGIASGQVSPLAPDLWWVRTIDVGYRLVKEGTWTSSQA